MIGTGPGPLDTSFLIIQCFSYNIHYHTYNTVNKGLHDKKLSHQPSLRKYWGCDHTAWSRLDHCLALSSVILILGIVQAEPSNSMTMKYEYDYDLDLSLDSMTMSDNENELV